VALLDGPLSVKVAGFLVAALIGICIAAWPSRIEGDRRVLMSASGFQTVSMLDGGSTGLYYDVGERVGQLRPGAHRVVLLGLGGGEMLRAARRTLPGAELIGVELSPVTAAIARRDFRVEDFGVRVVVDDAARYVEQVEAGAIDAYLVDIFDDSTLPLPFRSAPFFRACRRGLARNGLLLMNVWPASLAPDVSMAMLSAGFSAVRYELAGPNVVLIAER
jgi:spermidine synthase